MLFRLLTHASDALLQCGRQLNLQTSSANVTKLSEVLEKLSESDPSLQQPVFGSDAAKVKSWLDRVAAGLPQDQLKVNSSLLLPPYPKHVRMLMYGPASP